MLENLICFAAGVAVAALVGLNEVRKVYKVTGAALALSTETIDQAHTIIFNYRAHVKALQAEIRELTKVSDSTTH